MLSISLRSCKLYFFVDYILSEKTLSPIPGSRKKFLRVGRGISAGQGKTCGRGMRGQKSRYVILVKIFCLSIESILHYFLDLVQVEVYVQDSRVVKRRFTEGFQSMLVNPTRATRRQYTHLLN